MTEIVCSDCGGEKEESRMGFLACPFCQRYKDKVEDRPSLSADVAYKRRDRFDRQKILKEIRRVNP